MTRIISFSGISNSGKTTLIEGLCKILIPDFKVGVIKHDPKNKIIIDTNGKDSYKFFKTGADVAIVSPNQTTLRFQESLQNDEIMYFMNRKPLDYLFIEGFKSMPYKKICVVRDKFEEEQIINADAIATIKDLENTFANKTILNLNNYNEILNWIDSQW